MNTKKRMQEKTKSYFDKEAKEYDSSSDGKFVKCMYSEIVSRVMELQGRKILDLGCGNGNVIRMLQENREAEYSGVDISEAMILEAQKRVGKGVELKAADAAALPYNNDIFDIIICNASFHHYTDPDAALEEIKRVLKPGGTLVLGDPTIPVGPVRWLFNRGLQYGNSGDYRIYGKKEIIVLLSKHGLEAEKWKMINWHTFVLNAVKYS